MGLGWVQGQPGLHFEIQDSRGYIIRICFKLKQTLTSYYCVHKKATYNSRARHSGSYNPQEAQVEESWGLNPAWATHQILVSKRSNKQKDCLLHKNGTGCSTQAAMIDDITVCKRPLWTSSYVQTLVILSMETVGSNVISRAVPGARRLHIPTQGSDTRPRPWRPAFPTSSFGCRRLCSLGGWKGRRKWSAAQSPCFAPGNNCTWFQEAGAPGANLVSVKNKTRKRSCERGGPTPAP